MMGDCVMIQSSMDVDHSYPVTLLPKNIERALQAQPLLPEFGEECPQEQDFPPDIPLGKSLLSSLFTLFGLQDKTDELLAPERQAAKVKYKTALKEYQAAKAAFDSAEQAKLTPEALRKFRQPQIANCLEQSEPEKIDRDMPRVGAAEAYFFEVLIRYFPNRILRRRMLRTSQTSYYPDFLYYDPAHRLRINIELDEPYVLRQKMPVHFVENDERRDAKRDQVFLDAGWPVIRFAEQQVAESAEGCARVVADVIERLTGEVNDGLRNVQPIRSHKCWTRQEANLMADQDTRLEYVDELKRVELKPVQKKKKAFQPSQYQQRIFEFVEDGEGHGLVIAGAGSGKSTTLLQAIQRIKNKQPQSRVVLLAFNRSIKNELKEKLQDAKVRGCEVATLNGFGYQILVRSKQKLTQVDNKAVEMLKQAIRELWSQDFQDLSNQQKQEARKLYGLFQSYSQLNPSDPEHFKLLCTQYAFQEMDDLQPVVELALDLGIKSYSGQGLVTFDDQNYLPVKLNLEIDPYDFVFVDECQDLTQTQLKMVERAAGDTGRLLFVGDPHQAIMGFRGADNNSIHNIQNLPKKPTELKLPICYRCPTEHLSYARKLVPDLEAAPNAKQGEVYDHVPWEEAFWHVRERDLLFARTKVLVERIIFDLFATGFSIDYEESKLQKKEKKPEETQKPEEELVASSNRVAHIVKELRDHSKNFDPTKPPPLSNDPKSKNYWNSQLFRVLKYFYEQAQKRDEESFEELVHDATLPDSQMGVRVSTAHQAKGLEADRVFIMGHDRFNTSSTQQEWEQQQESNLEYVALTRAKDTMYLVKSPPIKRERGRGG